MRWILALLVSFVLGSALLAAPAFAQTAAAPSAAGPMSAPPSSIDEEDYRLGNGDKLKITVFGEEALSGEFLCCGGSGTISFPLIGDVQTAGQTTAQLQAEIEGKLKPDYLKDPKVTIELENYRPFYILGEVMKPGQYPYTDGLTVLNAVATANGFTYRAETRKAYIKRANGAGELAFPLDAGLRVQPGDTIRIGERFF